MPDGPMNGLLLGATGGFEDDASGFEDDDEGGFDDDRVTLCATLAVADNDR